MALVIAQARKRFISTARNARASPPRGSSSWRAGLQPFSSLAARKLLSTLLAWPMCLVALMLACVLPPTAITIYETVHQGGQLFDMDLSSLRLVTGTFTDRQDTLDLLSIPVGGVLASNIELEWQDAPQPPPAMPPAPLPAVYVGAGHNGSSLGCCRTWCAESPADSSVDCLDGDSSRHDQYIHEPELDDTECRRRCTVAPTCVAYEFSSWGCEVWHDAAISTAQIGGSSGGGDCHCYLRLLPLLPPSSPPTSPPAPPNPPLPPECQCATPQTGCTSGSLDVSQRCSCSSHSSGWSQPYCYTIAGLGTAGEPICSLYGARPSRWVAGAAWRTCDEPAPSPPPHSPPRAPAQLAPSEPAPTTGRRLQGSTSSRYVDIYYSVAGGLTLHALVGSLVANERRVNALLAMEQEVQRAAGASLMDIQTIVPCVAGVGLSPANPITSCSSTNSPLAWHVAVDCQWLVGQGTSGSSHGASCTAMRSRLTMDGAADFDAWLRKMQLLGNGDVQLSWRGEPPGYLYWKEFNITVLRDGSFVAISFLALFVLLSVSLRLPLFAALALLSVLATLPITFALYVGPLGNSNLPLLAIVSLYLILGVGTDSIFMFTNTYALVHEAETHPLPNQLPNPPDRLTKRQPAKTSTLTHADAQATNEASITLHPRPSSVPRASMAVVGFRSIWSYCCCCKRFLVPRPCTPSEIEELWQTLRLAGKMNTTAMLTTAVAFAASLGSSISTVRLFALFQTCCVIIEFALTLLVFVPLLVAWRESLFAVRKRQRQTVADDRGRYRAFHQLRRMLMLPLRMLLAPATPGFWDWLSPMVLLVRPLLLLGWICLLGAAAVISSALKPAGDQPTLFDLSHNLQRYPLIMGYGFGVSEVGLSSSLANDVSARLATAAGSECTRTGCTRDALINTVCDEVCNNEACWHDAGACPIPTSIAGGLMQTVPTTTTSSTTASTVSASWRNETIALVADPAKVTFVWGMRPTPRRHMLSGVPMSASLDSSQQLASESSQALIAALCDQLAMLPAARVRPDSISCPLLRIRDGRRRYGLTFPVPEAELLPLLGLLAREDAPSGSVDQVVGLRRINGTDRLVWLSVSLKTNVDKKGASIEALKESAAFFEGISESHNALAMSTGSNLHGWQVSPKWTWMEVVDEAISSTIATTISSALLTASVLLLLTQSLVVTLTTVGGVLVVLILLTAYFVKAGRALGIIEAIATTLFIGLACDYCVHVLLAYRSEKQATLASTLRHAGPALYGAALTTAGSAVPLLFAQVLPFRRFAEYIIVCTVLTLAVALFLIAPLVSCRSPNWRG